MKLQDRIVNYLITELGYQKEPTRSTKYVKLKTKDYVLWIGRKGAIRSGKTITDSVAAPRIFVDRIKQAVS
jgi:hypothetical protein